MCRADENVLQKTMALFFNDSNTPLQTLLKDCYKATQSNTIDDQILKQYCPVVERHIKPSNKAAELLMWLNNDSKKKWTIDHWY